MSQGKLPTGWDEKRVRRVLEHYEEQSEEDAVLAGCGKTSKNAAETCDARNVLSV